MTKNILNLGMVRICLISFILLCSVFTSEIAFSMNWNNILAKVSYHRGANHNYITISFLFHQYSEPGNHGYLSSCNFTYSEDGKIYNKLVSVLTRDQRDKDRVSITMHNKRVGENIKVFNILGNTDGIKMHDGRNLNLYVEVENSIHPGNRTDKGAYLGIKWDLLKTGTRVNFIKLDGLWCANGNNSQCDRIKEGYPHDNVKSNTNRLENVPSELTSEISNNVKVTSETDAITVTGAEPGEIIKIYTVSGIEVKSVVANEDVVNIKLPTNQMYVVKAGQTRFKVAL